MEPSGHAFGVPKDELREIGDSFIRGAIPGLRAPSGLPGATQPGRRLAPRGAGSGAFFHQVRAICVTDLEILDRSTSLDSRDQPARLPAAARPRLGWHKGIAILRKHLWVFAARSEALQPVCALDGTLAVENGNTLLELAHPRDDPHGQDPAGAFVQRPEITYRHRYQFVFNDCHAATACFVSSSRPQYSP